MVRASSLLLVVAYAFISPKIGAVRESPSPQQPKIDMRTFSLPQDTNSSLDLECMLGLSGVKIGQGAFSFVYTLDKSQFLAMKDRYEHDLEAKLIFKDLGQRMDPTKKYVIKLNWMMHEVGLNEIAAHSEAAGLGVAPKLAAGWVCLGDSWPRGLGARFSVLVMERMWVSIYGLYEHLCTQLNSRNQAEVIRVAALAQRAVLGVLERLAQAGVSHNDAHLENFFLDAEGRVRAIDFGVAKIDKEVDEGYEARKLNMFRNSIAPVWMSAKYSLDCLKDQLEPVTVGWLAMLFRFRKEALAIGTPEDAELELLSLGTVESLLRDPYKWNTFQLFVETPLRREPLVAGLFDGR